MRLANLLKPDYQHYEGVRPIQIHLGRIGYALVFLTVGYRSWVSLLTYDGTWEPIQAAAVAMWASSSVLSVIGIVYPLKTLPLVLFEIGYKLIWLATVAWPLGRSGQLVGSPAEGLTYAFLAVIIPIVVVPWGYVVRVYLLNRPSPKDPAVVDGADPGLFSF